MELNIKHEKQKAYMREYMKQRYINDYEKAKAYNNSQKCKRKFNLPPEDFQVYGEYLADIVKLRKIVKKIPNELFSKCLNEISV